MNLGLRNSGLTFIGWGIILGNCVWFLIGLKRVTSLSDLVLLTSTKDLFYHLYFFWFSIGPFFSASLLAKDTPQINYPKEALHMLG